MTPFERVEMIARKFKGYVELDTKSKFVIVIEKDRFFINESWLISDKWEHSIIREIENAL